MIGLHTDHSEKGVLPPILQHPHIEGRRFDGNKAQQMGRLLYATQAEIRCDTLRPHPALFRILLRFCEPTIVSRKSASKSIASTFSSLMGAIPLMPPLRQMMAAESRFGRIEVAAFVLFMAALIRQVTKIRCFADTANVVAFSCRDLWPSTGPIKFASF